MRPRGDGSKGRAGAVKIPPRCDVTRRSARSGLVAVLLLVGGAALAGDELSPTGKPEKYEEGQPPQFAVWSDGDGFVTRAAIDNNPRFHQT